MMHEEGGREADGASEKCELLTQLMGLPNGAWRDIMAGASARVDSLMEQATIREVIKILKTNSCCCQSVGVGFISQLGTVYLDMLNVYKAYSEHISRAVQAQASIFDMRPLFIGNPNRDHCPSMSRVLVSGSISVVVQGKSNKRMAPSFRGGRARFQNARRGCPQGSVAGRGRAAPRLS